MRLVSIAFAACLAATALLPTTTIAAEMTAFHEACIGAQEFLIGPVPEGKDAQPVLDALCPCLETGFAEYTQPEVDALTSDLRTGSPEEAMASYPEYEQLQEKATTVLGGCFASEAVMAAAKAQGL